MEEDSKSMVAKLIESSSEIIGESASSTAGFIIGGLIAGPGGAAIGGALSPFITKAFLKLGAEIKERTLGKREEIRIGATYSQALITIQNRINNGDEIRKDIFTQDKDRNRSGAEEILEGVLLAAQQEYEELKVKHFGNLVANISFRRDIDLPYANFLIKQSKNLTFREYCLLALFAKKDKFNLYTREIPSEKSSQDKTTLATLGTGKLVSISVRDSIREWKTDLGQEIKQLVELDLIEKEKDLSHSERFDKYKLTKMGNDFYQLLGLSELEEHHLSKIADLLRFKETFAYLTPKD